MSKTKKIDKARLDALNLPKMYMIFYENIDGVDYYEGALGSDDRLARNVNAIAIFHSIDELRRFHTDVVLSSFDKSGDDEVTTLDQKMYYKLVENINNTLTSNIDMDRLIKDVEENPDQTFRNIVKKLPFYDSLSPDVFQVMEDHKPDGYDVYSSCKYFNYTDDQKKLILFAFTFMNNIFSLHALAMHVEVTATLYITELKPEEIIHLWEVYTIDIQGDMNSETESKNFPMYQIWKQLEKDFWYKISKRKKVLGDYLEKIMNEIPTADTEVNMLDHLSNTTK